MKRIKAGDTVVVISGDDKGMKGKVLSVLGQRVLVEGVNMMKKFVKKNVMGKDQGGTMIDIERPFQISNVQLIDSKTGKGTKISYKMIDGKKARVSKKSNEVIVPVTLETANVENKKTMSNAEMKNDDAIEVKAKKTVKKVVKSKAKKNETA